MLIEKLEAVARGDIQNLMVWMPPGSAKSTYASVLFPAWFLAQDTSKSIIAASHTAELASSFGRRVRNTISEHSATLGYDIASDNAAADRWQVAGGGEYISAGVGGSITGRRADLALIDDPVASRQDADSELKRNRAWEWYLFDLRTRLKPNGRTIIIQTRWHEDDLSGRLIEHEAHKWEVLRLPMIAEENDQLGREIGEQLWAEWFTDDMVADAKRDERVWSALYQQRPSPETGDYFKKDWLRPTAQIPDVKTLAIYGGSDYAVSEGRGDYTVHVVIGVDPENRMYLLDLWRGQKDSSVWIDAFCDLVKQWKPLGWAEEAGQIKSSIGSFKMQRMRERQAYVHCDTFSTHGGNKSIRAQSIRGRIALNGIYYKHGEPWVNDLISEMMSFPAGKHDDQVDALGLVGQLLDKMVSGRKNNDTQKQTVGRKYKFDDDEGGTSWKLA